MSLTSEDAERVAVLGMRIANKLLHRPSVALREGDEAVRRALEEAFGLGDAAWAADDDA